MRLYMVEVVYEEFLFEIDIFLDAELRILTTITSEF